MAWVLGREGLSDKADPQPCWRKALHPSCRQFVPVRICNTVCYFTVERGKEGQCALCDH